MAPLLPLPCGGRENKRGALNPSVGHRRPGVHGLDLRVAQQLVDAFLAAGVAFLVILTNFGPVWIARA